MNTKKKYKLSDLEKRLGPMTLGGFLLSWRLSEDLSQKEFAEQLGISAANLCDIEKGRKGISPKRAAEIAKVIGYSEKVLIELSLNDLLQSSGMKWDVTLSKKAG